MIRVTRKPCPNPTALIADYKFPANKDALISSSHGKCMYCESKVTHVYFGDVEHIKPKALNKYPELEFVWENLGFACSKCNNSKRDKFHEDCPFIDPYTDDPEEHILAFGNFLFQRRGSERGAITIREIDLNRAELVERRNIHMQNIQKGVDACFRTSSPIVRAILLEELSQEAQPDKEFSVFSKALLVVNNVL